jgi:hypothetical protein
MWGKPANASTEPTHDWYVVTLDYDGPTDVVGVFESESTAWDWLEKNVQDGGMVFQLTSPYPIAEVLPPMLVTKDSSLPSDVEMIWSTDPNFWSKRVEG